jgi:histone H3/H4
MPRSKESIAPTAVASILKKGSSLRVSEKASKKATELVNDMLEQLGKQVAHAMILSKRKTVTNKFLMFCLESKTCGYHGSVDVLKSVSYNKRGKKERKPVAMETSLRVFRIGLANASLHISDDSRVAISSLAEGYLLALAAQAAKYTKVAKRQTLADKDIAAARESVDAHCE